MNLKQLLDHVQALTPGTTLHFGLSEPFAWRGIYAEVAFRIVEEPSTREDVLARIAQALQNTFYGYKGGEYKYDLYTTVHFEQDSGACTNGGYTAQWIQKLTGNYYLDHEHHLTCLLFPLPTS